MRNVELTVPVSPCLRIFIESLFDEIQFNRGTPWVSEARASTALARAEQEKGIQTGASK